MCSITLDSYSKVNIGLQIRNKRQDGYHNIHTIFQELLLHDSVTLDKIEQGWELTANQNNVPTDESNTCIKAYLELKKHFKKLGGVIINLEKTIPSGGGLGGGSSNAAAVLKGLNKLYDLGLSTNELEKIAVHVGADVPFFIKGGTQLGNGIGDDLAPVSNMFAGYYLLILPKVFISTEWAYKSYKKYLKDDANRTNFAHFLERKYLSDTIFDNDFERIVIPTYPEIGSIKNSLKDLGAIYASLSGSGSTVFGIFDEEALALEAELKFRKQYRTFLTKPTNI